MGTEVSEGMLSDIGVPAKSGVRVPLVEFVLEYGSWRVPNVLDRLSISSTRRSVGAEDEIANSLQAHIGIGGAQTLARPKFIRISDIATRMHVVRNGRIIAKLKGTEISSRAKLDEAQPAPVGQ